jgi:hypothetical protein
MQQPPGAPNASEPLSRAEEYASLAALAAAGALRAVRVAAVVLLGLLVCPPLAILVFVVVAPVLVMALVLGSSSRSSRRRTCSSITSAGTCSAVRTLVVGERQMRGMLEIAVGSTRGRSGIRGQSAVALRENPDSGARGGARRRGGLRAWRAWSTGSGSGSTADAEQPTQI